MTATDTAFPARADSARLALTVPGQEFVVLGFASVALFFVPYVANEYLQQVGYRALQFVALATAWNLLAGYTGMVCLGCAAFVGLGSYTVAELSVHSRLPTALAFLLAGLVAAAFAVLVSPAMFRLRGIYFTVGTLALAEALRLWMVNSTTFGGASGIFLEGEAPKAFQLYWLALTAAVLSTAVVMTLLRLPLALSLKAVRDDEDAARQMGVLTFRSKLWAFAISSFLIGLVGGIQALSVGVVEPYGSFGVSWTVDVVAVVIIGGIGTRVGPWVGAIFTVALAELLSGYPEVHLAITGVILLLVIRFAPRGLWGSLTDFTAARRRQQAGER